MQRNLPMSLVGLPVCVILLVINIGFLSFYKPANVQKTSNKPVASVIASGTKGTSQILSAQIESGDARPLLIEKFFQKFDSPLAEQSEIFVREADENSIDFRLTPAIAMCESIGGKRVPLKDGFNPFGIAVFTGQNSGKNFDSWEHAITFASKLLKEKYFDNGLGDLVSIGARWAPPSVAKGNSWALCVQSFIDQIL